MLMEEQLPITSSLARLRLTVQQESVVATAVLTLLSLFWLLLL